MYVRSELLKRWHYSYVEYIKKHTIVEGKVKEKSGETKNYKRAFRRSCNTTDHLVPLFIVTGPESVRERNELIKAPRTYQLS